MSENTTQQENFLFENETEYAKEMVTTIASRISKGILEDKYRYEPFTERFIKVIKEAKSYVDCGAEFGYYAQLALRNMNPEKADITLFEPEPSRVEALKYIFKDHQNVHILPYAVSNSKTELISLYKPTVDRSATIEKNIEYCSSVDDLKTITCKAVALDDFFGDKTIDVLKMDIEGAEIFAFEGMENLLAQKHTRIFLEYHSNIIGKMGEEKLKIIPEMLKKHSYKVYKCDGEAIQEIDYMSTRSYLVPGHLQP